MHNSLFLNVYFTSLYIFQADMCSSSGQSIVSIRHLVYATLCTWLGSKPTYQTVTYIEWHKLVPYVVLIQLNLLMMSTWLLETCRENWNKYIYIYIYIYKLCIRLVIDKNYTQMHGQQNIILSLWCFLDKDFWPMNQTVVHQASRITFQTSSYSNAVSGFIYHHYIWSHWTP